MSSTVEEIVSATYTPEQCEKRYRTMVRAIAAGRRHECDPAITEASGRFQIDSERDLAVARRRCTAAANIEAARARLVELKANPPTPPPNGQTPLTEFRTLGELAAAIMLVNNKATLWGPKVDHDAAIRAEEAIIKKAHSYLRATSDLSIDESIRAARATIERSHQASDAKVQLSEKLADMKRSLDRANPRSDVERSEVMSQRREHSELAKKLDGLPDVDREAAARAGDEIEKLAASQLSPENLQFTEPSGKVQGIYPVPCRFS